MSRSKYKALALAVGDHVLIGSLGYTMPGDWWFATVLWSSADEVLVLQHGIGGTTPHRHLHQISSVRARGSIPALVEFKERARKGMADFSCRVSDAESALGRARDEMWAELDRIGLAGPLSLDEPAR